ncbi:hypothetical protein H920_17758 [Fukomys damarensis]|uniref:Uncharacterized protein n=1 Tax=Fukomys damarensis TaxID=885580 RepID=A0A091CTR9_FUKDA|nr:hypothetical protein H920_17758 [Fukomys damarensis]
MGERLRKRPEVFGPSSNEELRRQPDPKLFVSQLAKIVLLVKKELTDGTSTSLCAEFCLCVIVLYPIVAAAKCKMDRAATLSKRYPQCWNSIARKFSRAFVHRAS